MSDELYDAYTSKVNQIESSSGEVAKGLFTAACLGTIFTHIDIYGSVAASDVLDIMHRVELILGETKDANV